MQCFTRPPAGGHKRCIEMQKMALKKVRPQDLVKNVEQLMEAAQEGRLYLAVNEVPSEDEVKNHVRAYVGQIRLLATGGWQNRVDDLWEKVFRHPELMAMLLPKPRARKCRNFDKYGVMRLVGVMRSYGVYENHVNDSQLCEALEHSKGDTCYRSYIGMGIESRPLRRELKAVIDKMST